MALVWGLYIVKTEEFEDFGFSLPVASANQNKYNLNGNGEYEALQYTDLLINNWSIFSGLSWSRTDYSVILKDDQVIEYGPGKIIKNKQNESPYTLIQKQY